MDALSFLLFQDCIHFVLRTWQGRLTLSWFFIDISSLDELNDIKIGEFSLNSMANILDMQFWNLLTTGLCNKPGLRCRK